MDAKMDSKTDTASLRISPDTIPRIGLRSHHSVNRLVRRWSLIGHILTLPAFHAFGHAHVILYRKSALRLTALNRSGDTVTATAEAGWSPLPPTMKKRGLLLSE
jgi:hypothetical protein